MDFPERFSNLPVATWPRLRALLDVPSQASDVINMTIGEPRHAFPAFVGDILADNLAGFNSYPSNEGQADLLSAMGGFLKRRYGLDVPNDQILALNGTREGLYNAAMALCPETKNGEQPVVLTPNPFYPVYGVAALSVGAEPIYVPATEASGHLPDFEALPPETLARTACAYVCSPANPQGAVADEDYWRRTITLAETHDFKIFADECYSEIYRDTPPPGALQVATDMGADPDRVVIFQSLSKRSNLPGLRCGFAAGGAKSIMRMRQLRAFAGAPLPGPLQAVATKVWADEGHVVENRALYNRKYQIADDILGHINGYQSPQAGFFLWLPVDDGEAAALKLWQETGVRTLPGAYLSQEVNGENPGAKYIRVALVAPTQEMQRGLTLIRDCLYG
ncbi:aminotransferase class I/II-fold pyridoxal phosphate-dependent enzyme [Yoonia sediminilitoris]|uniref:Aspartate/methionine/tyrosine aminotransferase n=1 Tax=Yoonia sediminilitoris TaxID=1286148 RepID=A0A2T6KH49_9RHOB|nr:aminotransferase class I/II-fold pyridoxal phosphate-dependent enzyme [Yoonia sediminilitoris]PUB14832.1 aspartate/methionine/tyrosine aminotransferase [Yoonia sediminilitoris]RCW95549.1 aspartate/methionine/tyrosine aminotransferase [Yoonia sediminilitoris]